MGYVLQCRCIIYQLQLTRFHAQVFRYDLFQRITSIIVLLRRLLKQRDYIAF